MVNRERLRSVALRAYEWGRLRMAMRIAGIVVPVTILCALETRAGETCLCLGVLLLGTAVYLRWRSCRGRECARYGLAAGAFPLVFGLGVGRFAPPCIFAPLSTFAAAPWLCASVCLGVSALCGLWLGQKLAQITAELWSSIGAVAVAALAASLGCVGFGLGGVVGAVVGLTIGAVPALAQRR